MNPQLFFQDLEAFVQRMVADALPIFTPQALLQAQALIELHFRRDEALLRYGFDPYFHFQVKLAANPATRSIKVNLIPLTVAGLEFLMAQPGVVIDESLQKRIRQYQNQQLMASILSAGQREALLAERSLRHDAGQEQEPVREARLEEQGLAKEDGSGGVLPVVDPGHDGAGRLEDRAGEGYDTNGGEPRGDCSDSGVLRSPEGAPGQGPLEVQGPGRQ